MRNILFLFIVLTSGIAYGSIDDVIHNTCKISGPKRIGSGAVFGKDNDKFWIATAGHVVTGLEEVKIRFYFTGKESHEMIGKVVWSFHEGPDDFGVVNLHKSEFSKNIQVSFPSLSNLLNMLQNIQIYPFPTVIPIGNSRYELKQDSIILSCGCADGAWPTLWRGHITEVIDDGYKKGTVKLKPHPAGGRSGSGIYDADGTVLLGIIIWRTEGGEVASGTAIALPRIYKLTQWKT